MRQMPRDAVLVHGFQSGPHIWNHLEKVLQNSQVTPHPVDLQDTKRSIAENAKVVKNAIEGAPSGTTFDLVAHSMGGLVSRYYLKNLADEQRIQNFVALGTPNHGTSMAKWAQPWATSAGQMVPGSEFLGSLNAGTETPGGASYTTVAGTKDTTASKFSRLEQPNDGVVPAASVRLDGASNHQVHCTHSELYANKQAVDLTLKAIGLRS